MKKTIVFFCWINLILISLSVIIFLLLFDVLTYKITDKWKLFFNYYEGYRLPASISAFVPFAEDIIRKEKNGKTIVFTGDSTSGGLLYHHSQAIPAYLQSYLTNNSIKSRTFNLPLSGAHLSEQYLLLKELSDAFDFAIFPIHYSFFSGRGPENSYISHPELVVVLRHIDESDVASLNLKPNPSINFFFDQVLGNIWYTYRVRKIIPYIALGKPIPAWLRFILFQKIPMTPTNNEASSIAVDKDVAFSKQLPAVQSEILKQNVLLWENINYVDDNNVNLLYLRKIGELKRKSGKKLYAYFVPLDSETLTRHKILDQKKYQQIISKAKDVLTEYDIPFTDFNLNNPAQLSSEDFYNPDHLLPNGNKKVGFFLAKEIISDF